MEKTEQMLSRDELNPTDKAILDALHEFPKTPKKIAEECGKTAGNVRNRVTHLRQHNHIRSIGGGMYELVDDPRE